MSNFWLYTQSWAWYGNINDNKAQVCQITSLSRLYAPAWKCMPKQ